MTSNTSINVAQLLLSYIKLEQDAPKSYVFGVLGAAFMQVLYEMKADPQMQYVITKHESGAAYMAHGYYLSTGKLGVVMVTSGFAKSSKVLIYCLGLMAFCQASISTAED